jgi:hypothetical protein
MIPVRATMTRRQSVPARRRRLPQQTDNLHKPARRVKRTIAFTPNPKQSSSATTTPRSGLRAPTKINLGSVSSSSSTRKLARAKERKPSKSKRVASKKQKAVVKHQQQQQHVDAENSSPNVAVASAPASAAASTSAI